MRTLLFFIALIPVVSHAQSVELYSGGTSVFFAQKKIDDNGYVNRYKSGIRPHLGIAVGFRPWNKFESRAALHYQSLIGRIDTGYAYKVSSAIAELDYHRDIISLRWAPLVLASDVIEFELGWEHHLLLRSDLRGRTVGSLYSSEFQGTIAIDEETVLTGNSQRLFGGVYVHVNIPASISDKHVVVFRADWSIRSKSEWAGLETTRKGMAISVGLGLRWKHLASSRAAE